MTEIIFIVVKPKKTKKQTQNDPQSALIWRNTLERRKNKWDCLVDTWKKPIQFFIGKLGNFLAKCLCIC